MTQRIRLTFTKQEALRYIGHLDLHKVIERTVRRAGLPLAYSHGYHPKPKMHLASALPLGFASRAEVMDLWLDDDHLDLDALPERLTRFAPAGLRVLDARPVEAKAASLQDALREAEYEITFRRGAEEIRAAIQRLLSAESLPRERRGKPYDLRPLIQAFELTGNQPPRAYLRLTARPGATGRPDEVLDAMQIPLEEVFIERIGLRFAE